MPRSATDVMHDILLAAVMDSLDALKGASRGVPNILLRDINAIHRNAAFADLPKEVQAAISANVRAAFNRLLKEGYSVSPASGPPERPGPPRSGPPRSGPPRAPDGQRRPRPPGGPDGQRRRPGPPRPPRKPDKG